MSAVKKVLEFEFQIIKLKVMNFSYYIYIFIKKF